MSSTFVLTIVTPDSAQSVKDQLVTTPVTGALKDRESIERVANYINAIAQGETNNTSITITSIS